MFFLLLGKTSLIGNENLSTNIWNFEMKYSSSISSIWSSILSSSSISCIWSSKFCLRDRKSYVFSQFRYLTTKTGYTTTSRKRVKREAH